MRSVMIHSRRAAEAGRGEIPCSLCCQMLKTGPDRRPKSPAIWLRNELEDVLSFRLVAKRPRRGRVGADGKGWG